MNINALKKKSVLTIDDVIDENTIINISNMCTAEYEIHNTHKQFIVSRIFISFDTNIIINYDLMQIFVYLCVKNIKGFN